MKQNLSIVLILMFILMFQNVCYSSEFLNNINTVMHIDRDDFQSVFFGGGAVYSKSPYIDVDDDIIPFPILKGEYKNFYADVTTFGYYLKKDEAVNLSLVFSPRFMGYDSGDSSALSGMDDRDWSIDTGLDFDWKTDYVDFNLKYLFDSMNRHQGQEFVLSFSKEFFDGFLTPSVGFKWQSEDLVDYYYGVLGNEGTGSRVPYEGNSTVNFFVGLKAGYPITENWIAVGSVVYEDYGAVIEKSPIVDEDNQVSSFLGVAYKF